MGDLIGNRIVLVQPDMMPWFDQYPLHFFKKGKPMVPLGLLSLAAVLEKHEYDVTIIDNYVKAYSTQTLAQKILALAPKFVGFSATSVSIQNALDATRRLKEERSDIVTILGGSHPTIFPETTASDPHVDYVVQGEGENVLKELLGAVDKRRDTRQIRGLCFRDAQSNVENTGRGDRITALDDLPFSARHLVDMNEYCRRGSFLQIYPTDVISSSRGCPFRCSFCGCLSCWGPRYMTRSPQSVVDEIEMLQRMYGTRGIYFREGTFTGKPSRVVDLCLEILRRKVHVYWECVSRVDALTKETVSLMRRAGCRAIWCGVESGNQQTLDRLNKGTTLAQAQQAYQWMRAAGIRGGASFMIGIPGETRANIMETLRFARRLRVDSASFQAYVALPGSELYAWVLREGMYAHKLGDICLVQTPSLTHAEVAALERIVNRRYYRSNIRSRLGYLKDELCNAVRAPRTLGVVSRIIGEGMRRLVK